MTELLSFAKTEMYDVYSKWYRFGGLPDTPLRW